MSQTVKRLIPAFLCLVMLFMVTGCQSGSATNPIPAPQASAPVSVPDTTAPEEEIRTQTVSTVMGDIEVPVNPKRVACYTWAGDLLALGITPVISNDAELPIMADILSGTEMSWFSDPEEILAADPDLIIIRDREKYEEYSKIAPTLLVEYNTTLDERMAFFGKVFGVEEKAQQVLDDFYTKVDHYVQDFKDHGIYGKTISIMFYSDTSPYIYGDDYGFGGQVLYKLLGFTVPDIIQKEIIDTGEGFRSVSWEVAGEYLNSDYIQVGEETLDAQTLETLSENTIWNSVEAVKNNQIITYSRDYDRKSLYVLDKIVDYYYEQFMQLAVEE